jgi:hypothetical protein
VLLLRKLLIGVAFGAIGVSVAASAATGRSSQQSMTTSELMPGVTYTREVDFTSRGPVVLDVLIAPKPDGKAYSLAPALSNDVLRGRESLTRLENRVAHGATTVAIDGDYFDRATGTPNGMLMQNGVLESPPATGRSSLGIRADGTLMTGRPSSAGIWQGSGQRRPLLLNTPAGSGKFSLYTPVYGSATPSETGVVEAVIGTLPAAHLDTPLDGTVTQVTTAGPTPIPRGGAVLVARGAQSTAQLEAEAKVGQKVEAMLSLSPGWGSFASAIGGGPLLVRNGKPLFHVGESFAPRDLNSRRARGAIGQLPDGRLVLVAVEGAKAAYSIGMSNYELGIELSRLGVNTAFGLGAGSAAGLAFNGQLLTRTPTGATPKVSDALVLSYSGIWAAPPSTAVLSPNGDGVGDTEGFSYGVVRPSHVVASLAGPGGAEVTLASGAQTPGLHSVAWNGKSGGTVAAEGQWTFTITGTDDQNVTTSAQRTFSLDDTLSSLAVAGGDGFPTATFQLTRGAMVVVQIQRLNGVPVATLRSGQLTAGAQQVKWLGKIGRHRAPSGRYIVAVQATSSVGTSSLEALFSWRAHTRH